MVNDFMAIIFIDSYICNYDIDLGAEVAQLARATAS